MLCVGSTLILLYIENPLTCYTERHFDTANNIWNAKTIYNIHLYIQLERREILLRKENYLDSLSLDTLSRCGALCLYASWSAHVFCSPFRYCDLVLWKRPVLLIGTPSGTLLLFCAKKVGFISTCYFYKKIILLFNIWSSAFCASLILCFL